MNVAAIIPAAGVGKRMGSEIQKQFIELGGKPVIVHTLLKFQMAEMVNSVYLVVPQGKKEYCRTEIVERYNITKVAEVISGGEKRQDSVYNGFVSVNNMADIIVIHDGVRPFVTEDMIKKAVIAADKYGAAIVAIPEKDTVKEVSEDLMVEKTLNRRLLWRIQTPQVFRRSILKSAFEKAIKDGYYGTDEASLAERAGYSIKVVTGSDFNIKITTPDELILGNAILNYREFKNCQGVLS